MSDQQPPPYSSVSPGIYHIQLDDPTTSAGSTPIYPLYPLPTDPTSSLPDAPPPSYNSLYGDEATAPQVSTLSVLPPPEVSTLSVLPPPPDVSFQTQPPLPPPAPSNPSIILAPGRRASWPDGTSTRRLSESDRPSTPPPPPVASAVRALHRSSSITAESIDGSIFLAFLSFVFCPIIGISALFHDVPALRNAKNASNKNRVNEVKGVIKRKFGASVFVAAVIIITVVLVLTFLGRKKCSSGHYFGPYSSDMRYFSEACLPCPAGTFNCHDFEIDTNNWENDPGITRCKPCPAGHSTRSDNRKKCFPCEKGTYAPSEGHAECRECEVGGETFQKGQTVCQECPNSAPKTVDACSCPYGYMSGDPEGSCVKKKTIENQNCRNDSFCGKNEGRDYHWCYVEERHEIFADGNGTGWGGEWSYCCAKGQCCAKGKCGAGKAGDDEKFECWVDDYEVNSMSCEADVKQKEGTNWGAVGGGIFAFIAFGCICRGKHQKK